MHQPATNRQKKVLRFFGVSFGPNLSLGAASWEIDGIMESDDNRRRWEQYKFLTRDFDRDSSELKPFSVADLQATAVPDGWDSKEETHRLDVEFVAGMVSTDSPYDRPEPPVAFRDRDFVFTGKFSFGSRKKCEAAVVARGGRALAGVSGQVEYLVVGSLGSPSWSRGSYGSKLEQAVLLRREHGRPAIISEEHWVIALASAATPSDLG